MFLGSQSLGFYAYVFGFDGIGDCQAPPSSFDRYSWLFSFPMPFVKAEMWRNAFLFGMLLFFWGRPYVPQTSLKILLLLPLPHKWWDYRSALTPPVLCSTRDWPQGLVNLSKHFRYWAHPQPLCLTTYILSVVVTETQPTTAWTVTNCFPWCLLVFWW